MAALERTTVRRARIQRRCGDGGCPPIQPGDLYLEHVVSPGHIDLGNSRWRRLAECRPCAERYGRAGLFGLGEEEPCRG